MSDLQCAGVFPEDVETGRGMHSPALEEKMGPLLMA